VDRWLDGDLITPPATRKMGRNARWRHLKAAHIISMPDTWEYPWFAAWDLAFHAVPLLSLIPIVAGSRSSFFCPITISIPVVRFPPMSGPSMMPTPRPRLGGPGMLSRREKRR
jgi:hypothetical protein